MNLGCSYLLHHLVAENGVLGQHLERHEAARVGVDGELDFGKGAATDGASHGILAHPAHAAIACSIDRDLISFP